MEDSSGSTKTLSKSSLGQAGSSEEVVPTRNSNSTEEGKSSAVEATAGVQNPANKDQIVVGVDLGEGVSRSVYPWGITLNRVLTVADRERLGGMVETLVELSPDICSRKIPDALFQQAQALEVALVFATGGGRSVLVIGANEDPTGPALSKLGFDVELSDPVLDGRDMAAVYDQFKGNKEFDLVLSISVIEHASNPEEFVQQMTGLLAPGGVAFLTADYKAAWKAGDPIHSLGAQMFTAEGMWNLVLSRAPETHLLGGPMWEDYEGDEYFEFEGHRYVFASFAVIRDERAD